MLEPAPPLHPEIAALAHMVRTQARWQVPEFVGDVPRRGVQQLRWMLGGAALLLLVPTVIAMAQEAPWGLPVLGAVLLAARALWRWWWRRQAWPLGSLWVWFDDSANAPWRGCAVDVALRTVRTVGLQHNRSWTLQPEADWSLGLQDMSTIHYGHGRRQLHIGCAVELRHVRQGPVVVLCSMSQPHNHTAHRVQIEQLVDDMAQQLGIRRSGTGSLLAPALRPSAPSSPPPVAPDS